MSKLTITLKIAGGNYPFTIDAAEEELYRKAERLVAERMFDFNQINLPQKDQLALAALALGMENLRLKQTRSLGEDLDRLSEVEERLDQYLSEL
ncbi:MAG: cell division protein ZapA [Rikenellaceae bacterium]|nr:cell division protein ZapA [Rikenellaceae bacterium]